MAAKGLYTLTQEDLDIFEKARHDGRYFTNYYLREPGEETGWRFDHNIDPPWQLAMHHAQQKTEVIIGGMGSGKTGAVGASILTWATMVPNFKALVVAPNLNQAAQMYTWIIDNMAGTIYEERFIARDPVEKPYPKIFIAYKLPNGRTVRSKIEFMSASEQASRIKNYEGDLVCLDQAEMADDLGEAVAFLGTRLRGNIKKRSRLGRLILLANADDNVELWGQFDNGEEYPDKYLSLLVSTYSNGNLTPEQIESFKLRMGNDPEKIKQHLEAKRPVGGGFEFKKELMDKVWDTRLDAIMEDALAEGKPLFELKKKKGADVIEWVMPYEPGHDYVVWGDPGMGNAPERNAPVVAVFDMTDYPKTPITMRAFWWGHGGGLAAPFINQFKLWLTTYKAVLGAYDSTGGQKVHSEISFAENLNVQPIDMSGIKKKAYMTVLKLLFDKGWMRIPANIKGINNQFLKYRLPDDKLNQDIVGMFLVGAGLLWSLGYAEDLEGEQAAQAQAEQVAQDRYARAVADRHSRDLVTR